MGAAMFTTIPKFLFVLLMLVSLSSMALEKQAQDLLDEAKAQISNISTDQLESLLEQDPTTFLLDVREFSEIHALGGTIKAFNNVNLPRGWLEMRVAETIPDKNTPIIVYCGINQRSPLAAKTLMDMGYINVKNYQDGFFAWRDLGLPVYHTDKYPESLLYSKLEMVIDGVWTSIGATQPATYENSGHNNNLSVVIGEKAALVVNAGANYLLAKAFHQEIQKITDKPVKYVMLENGQGHAALGSNYWKEQGAVVIAQHEVIEELDTTGGLILDQMKAVNKDKALGTELVYPDKTFKQEMMIDLGGQEVVLKYLGPAHSPGDSVVWLPAEKLVISGDMAFYERMPPIFSKTNTLEWIESWDNFEALGAKIVIPGHGGVTDMSTVREGTIGYLKYLRGKIEEVLDNDGGLDEAYYVDQSPYIHLDTFHELATRNAGRVFQQMEFE